MNIAAPRVPETFFLRPGREVDLKFLGELTEEGFRDKLERIGGP